MEAPIHHTPSCRENSANFSRDGKKHVSSLSTNDRDESFLALLVAFRISGGLATGSEIALRRPNIGISQLAKWIANNEVTSFEWRENLWLPAFQFESSALALRPIPRQVALELSSVLDGWELAKWWVEPDASLSAHTPLIALNMYPERVLQAARATRFAIAG